MGMVASALDDPGAAVADLSSCTDSPYTRKKALAELAALAQRRGDAAAAEQFTRRAGAEPKDMDWPDPYLWENAQLAVGEQNRFLEGEQLQRAGRLAEAASQFRDLIKDYPDDAPAPRQTGHGPRPAGGLCRRRVGLARGRPALPGRVAGLLLSERRLVPAGGLTRQPRRPSRHATVPGSGRLRPQGDGTQTRSLLRLPLLGFVLEGARPEGPGDRVVAQGRAVRPGQHGPASPFGGSAGGKRTEEGRACRVGTCCRTGRGRRRPAAGGARALGASLTKPE